ncbi:MAG: hypothetical protein U9N83_20005 [Thermodesulfobacteriota bacterium]|nr:hypothetical protein [Thermodesulfobacteriota bacterium]
MKTCKGAAEKLRTTRVRLRTVFLPAKQLKAYFPALVPRLRGGREYQPMAWDGHDGRLLSPLFHSCLPILDHPDSSKKGAGIIGKKPQSM